MTIPHPVRVGILVIGATTFYTYVGQMVPQNEVQPPQETVIRADLTTADMVKVGREVMEGKGLCFTCHTIGKAEGPFRFPDLAGVDERAKMRVPGLSDVEYFAQSLYEPEKFIVPGFNPGMPVINRPPIGLTDQEILCVIAYLQTLGGTATVTLQTSHAYYKAPGGAAPGAPGEAPAPAAAEGTAPPGAPGEQPAKPGEAEKLTLPPAQKTPPPSAPTIVPGAPAKGTR
jgi:hypothetical protein